MVNPWATTLYKKMKSKFFRSKIGLDLDHKLKQSLSDSSTAHTAFVLKFAVLVREATDTLFYQIKIGFLAISTRRRGLSGGLGLRLGCAVIKSYNGVRKVEANMGKDSKFIVIIP